MFLFFRGIDLSFTVRIAMWLVNLFHPLALNPFVYLQSNFAVVVKKTTHFLAHLLRKRREGFTQRNLMGVPHFLHGTHPTPPARFAKVAYPLFQEGLSDFRKLLSGYTQRFSRLCRRNKARYRAGWGKGHHAQAEPRPPGKSCHLETDAQVVRLRTIVAP